MKIKFLYLFLFIGVGLLYAQKAINVSYKVLPIAPNSKTYSIQYDVDFRRYKKSKHLKASVLFTLEKVKSSELNNLNYTGETVDTFIESFSNSNSFKRNYVLPTSFSFSEQLENDKVYRIIAEPEGVINTKSKKTFGVIKLKSPEVSKIEVGGNYNYSPVTVKFIDFPEKVQKGEKFEFSINIKTSEEVVNEGIASTSAFHFEIHQVDEGEVYNPNVYEGNLISSSETISLNKDEATVLISIQAPDKESSSIFLSDSKYQLKLVNEDYAENEVYHFPKLLTVIDKDKKENDLVLKNKKVELYPNPAKTRIIVDKNIKTRYYKVYNIGGKFIKQAPAMGVLLISDLKPGIYYLVTDTGVTKFTKV